MQLTTATTSILSSNYERAFAALDAKKADNDAADTARRAAHSTPAFVLVANGYFGPLALLRVAQLEEQTEWGYSTRSATVQEEVIPLYIGGETFSATAARIIGERFTDHAAAQSRLKGTIHGQFKTSDGTQLVGCQYMVVTDTEAAAIVAEASAPVKAAREAQANDLAKKSAPLTERTEQAQAAARETNAPVAVYGELNEELVEGIDGFYLVGDVLTAFPDGAVRTIRTRRFAG